MFFVVVQEIVAKWRKNARGGKDATQRNAVSEAFPIPGIMPLNFSSALVHDNVDFYQDVPRHHLAVNEFKPQQKLDCGCAMIFLDENTVSVTFTYNRDCGGAPERTSYPREVLTLPLSTWGRILYNGRFSGLYSGHWTYRKTVLNIGYFDTFKSNLFLKTAPYRVFSEMADLW